MLFNLAAIVFLAVWFALGLLWLVRLYRTPANRNVAFKLSLQESFVFVILLFLAFSISGTLVMRLVASIYGDANALSVLNTFILQIFIIALVCLYSKKIDNPVNFLNAKSPSGFMLVSKGTLSLFAFYPTLALLAGLWKLLLEALGYDIISQTSVLMMFEVEDPFVKILLIVSVLLLAPTAEELLFRGFFYGALKSKINKYISALIISVIFGAIHNTLYAFLPIVLLSLFLTFLYEKSGDIRYPIGAHAAFNLINLIMLYACEVSDI